MDRIPLTTVQPVPAESQSGRPAGLRPGYALMLEREATRQANLKQSFLADPQLRLREAALIAGVSTSHIRVLIRKKLLPATKTSPRGHLRIRLSHLRALVKSLEVA